MTPPTLRRLLSVSLLVTVLVAQARAEAPKADPTKQPIAVALYSGAGASGTGPKMLEETLRAKGEFQVTRITPEDIRAGKLKNFQILIMPGGVSSTQGVALGEDGREMVRKFIADGGTYVGICAGCYLASSHYTWSLNVLPVKVVDSPNWERGIKPLSVELTREGKDWLSHSDKDVKVKYHNGPVLQPLPDAREKLLTLATYREEVTKKGAKEGLMIDTPAMVAARYRKGWVIGISPHPEQTEGLRGMIPSAVRWALDHAAKD